MRGLGHNDSAPTFETSQARMTAIRESRPVTEYTIDGARLSVAKVYSSFTGARFATVLGLYQNLAVSGVYALGAGLRAMRPVLPVTHLAVDGAADPVADFHLLERRADKATMLGGFQNGPGAGVRTGTTSLRARGEFAPWGHFAVNGARAHVALLVLTGGVTRFASV